MKRRGHECWKEPSWIRSMQCGSSNFNVYIAFKLSRYILKDDMKWEYIRDHSSHSLFPAVFLLHRRVYPEQSRRDAESAEKCLEDA